MKALMKLIAKFNILGNYSRKWLSSECSHIHYLLYIYVVTHFDSLVDVIRATCLRQRQLCRHWFISYPPLHLKWLPSPEICYSMPPAAVKCDCMSCRNIWMVTLFESCRERAQVSLVMCRLIGWTGNLQWQCTFELLLLLNYRSALSAKQTKILDSLTKRSLHKLGIYNLTRLKFRRSCCLTYLV